MAPNCESQSVAQSLEDLRLCEAETGAFSLPKPSQRASSASRDDRRLIKIGGCPMLASQPIFIRVAYYNTLIELVANLTWDLNAIIKKLAAEFNLESMLCALQLIGSNGRAFHTASFDYYLTLFPRSETIFRLVVDYRRLREARLQTPTLSSIRSNRKLAMLRNPKTTPPHIVVKRISTRDSTQFTKQLKISSKVRGDSIDRLHEYYYEEMLKFLSSSCYERFGQPTAKKDERKRVLVSPKAKKEIGPPALAMGSMNLCVTIKVPKAQRPSGNATLSTPPPIVIRRLPSGNPTLSRLPSPIQPADYSQRS